MADVIENAGERKKMTAVLKNCFRKQTRDRVTFIVATVVGESVSLGKVDFDPAATLSLAPATHKRKRELEGDAPIRLVERVDAAGLQFVRANLELLKREERTKFLHYANAMLANGHSLDMGYRLKEHGYGRYYPDEISMQGLNRRLRSTIALPLYYDIDASNAHPVVLAAISNERGWYTPCLDYYIKNREAVLSSTGLPRWLAKQLILQQTYGGSVYNFILEKLEQNYIVGEVAKWMARVPQFVYEYGHEIRQIAQQVRRVDPALYELAVSRKAENAAACALSLYVQTRETAAILCAMKAIRSRGWEVGVLVHDGFMVYRRDAENLKITRALLNMVGQSVRNECGLSIEFETKEFEPPFTQEVVPVPLPA